jgi:hypothetical protein
MTISCVSVYLSSFKYSLHQFARLEIWPYASLVRRPCGFEQSSVLPLLLLTLVHAHERACSSAHVFKHSLIFGRILFKFAGHILGYILIMFTHRAHVCKRVIKHSLIYSRILFKCVVNRLQITTRSMAYVLFMFMHRVHVCKRARAWFSVRIFLDGFSSNLLGTLQITTSSMGYILFMVCVCDCMS